MLTKLMCLLKKLQNLVYVANIIRDNKMQKDAIRHLLNMFEGQAFETVSVRLLSHGDGHMTFVINLFAVAVRIS